MNWNNLKRMVQTTVLDNGQVIQWLQRSEDFSQSSNTGSSITFGYLDPTVTWTTGSFKGIVDPVRENDPIIQSGYSAEQYAKVYINPNETPSQWDQLLIPSGSATRYLILSIREYTPADVTVAKILNVRRLTPKSGSAY
jgi:hypothetical protein